jgi:O-antigen/teichoic acid export membrane protein
LSNYKKLINNSLVFAVGSLGTKFIIFFLVPIHTYYLTTNEFGMVDLLTATVNLLIPIFTMSISQSVLRFVMDKSYDKQTVLMDSIVVTFVGFFLLFLMYPLIEILLPFDEYIPYFYFLLFVQSIFNVLSQYIRANGEVKLFAIGGIINAFILLVSNIAFLMFFGLGLIGYLLSLIIAHMFSSFYLCIRGKVLQDLNLKKINLNILVEMLKYSIPLIPNALMWWVMGLSDRYIITYFLGLSANGIYAVSSKIPSILNIVNSVFFQAWQMSAIEEANSKHKSKFFSNVFNVFSLFMLVATSLLLMHLKLIIDLIAASDYYHSWKYVPFLLIGTVFASFSSFLGTNYIAAKRTSGVIKTSLLGAIVNVCANILLIPIIGINGASIGTMLSFAVIWLLRIYDTKQFVKIEINVKKLLSTLIIIFIQIGVLYINMTFEYLIQVALFMVIILINYQETKIMVVKILGILLTKFKKSKQG